MLALVPRSPCFPRCFGTKEAGSGLEPHVWVDSLGGLFQLCQLLAPMCEFGFQWESCPDEEDEACDCASLHSNLDQQKDWRTSMAIL